MPLLLAACGGGSNTGDVNPSVPPPAAAASGPNSFLLFPNPLLQPDGSLQTNTAAYADAYYAAIDPTNARDTFAKWKAVNSFDSGTGTQVQAVFGDVRDLGYGRRMTARRNTDGTLAFYVENYLVALGPEYVYSSLNLDAAVVQDSRWLILVNAVEFSPGPAGGVPFAKFYSFDPLTGVRQGTVDLDGHGAKAMPGPCITCHGGRGDPLTPPSAATGKPLFNLVQNSASGARGDVQGRVQAFDVDSFDFSATAGYTRAEQEATLKLMNQWVLCSYPLASASAFPEDACRRAAVPAEWAGTVANLIKQGYGGDGMPNAVFSGSYVPPGWSGAGQAALYQSVVVPACRTCHQARGSQAQSDVDFDSYAKFLSYAGSTKSHVLDAGDMPLAKLVYDNFWASGGPDALANFLTAQGVIARDATGAVLKPGRPVTALMDRVVRQGPTTLIAPDTRFASTYSWTVLSGPDGAMPAANVTLTNAASAQPVFNAAANGTYVVQLVVGNSVLTSAPATANIVVNGALAIAPSAIRFGDIKAVLTNPSGCAVCHQPDFPLVPVFFANTDRDGNGTVGDATDDLWFYAEVAGRVDLAYTEGSKLLSKPAGNHHGGGLQAGFDTSKPAGDPARANYDLFLNWILNNAPR
jgi:mono/diheme cytochrome c family protein